MCEMPSLICLTVKDDDSIRCVKGAILTELNIFEAFDKSDLILSV